MENYAWNEKLQVEIPVTGSIIIQPHCTKVFINRDITLIGTDIKFDFTKSITDIDFNSQN